MIVGQGVYRKGTKVEVAGDFSAQSDACGGDSFVWLGLKNPTRAELGEAANAGAVDKIGALRAIIRRPFCAPAIAHSAMAGAQNERGGVGPARAVGRRRWCVNTSTRACVGGVGSAV